MSMSSPAVPLSFWLSGGPISIHLRKISEGTFKFLDTDFAQAFLNGSRALSVPEGSVDLVEMMLTLEEQAGIRGIKPLLHFRRLPVGPDGKLDFAAVAAADGLPPERRRAKHGWWPTEADRGALQAVIAAVANSEPTEFEHFVLGMFA